MTMTASLYIKLSLIILNTCPCYYKSFMIHRISVQVWGILDRSSGLFIESCCRSFHEKFLYYVPNIKSKEQECALFSMLMYMIYQFVCSFISKYASVTRNPQKCNFKNDFKTVHFVCCRAVQVQAVNLHTPYLSGGWHVVVNMLASKIVYSSVVVTEIKCVLYC